MSNFLFLVRSARAKQKRRGGRILNPSEAMELYSELKASVNKINSKTSRKIGYSQIKNSLDDYDNALGETDLKKRRCIHRLPLHLCCGECIPKIHNR